MTCKTSAETRRCAPAKGANANICIRDNDGAMLVQYTVILLLNAPHGSLAEIELAHPGMPSGERRWLWIEANWVTLLHPVTEGTPTLRVFDRAVLTLNDMRGELRWPSGQRDALSVDPDGELRPEFRRLVHQHLN